MFTGLACRLDAWSRGCRRASGLSAEWIVWGLVSVDKRSRRKSPGPFRTTQLRRCRGRRGGEEPTSARWPCTVCQFSSAETNALNLSASIRSRGDAAWLTTEASPPSQRDYR